MNISQFFKKILIGRKIPCEQNVPLSHTGKSQLQSLANWSSAIGHFFPTIWHIAQDHAWSRAVPHSAGSTNIQLYLGDFVKEFLCKAVCNEYSRLETGPTRLIPKGYWPKLKLPQLWIANSRPASPLPQLLAVVAPTANRNSHGPALYPYCCWPKIEGSFHYEYTVFMNSTASSIPQLVLT
jgi:hypothetical protein